MTSFLLSASASGFYRSVLLNCIFLIPAGVTAQERKPEKVEVLINYNLLNENQKAAVQSLLEKRALSTGIVRKAPGKGYAGSNAIKNIGATVMADLPAVSAYAAASAVSRLDFTTSIKSMKRILPDEVAEITTTEFFKADTVKNFAAQPATAVQELVVTDAFARKLMEAVETNRGPQNDSIAITSQITAFSQDNLEAEQDTLNISRGFAESSMQQGSELKKYAVDSSLLPMLSTLSGSDFRKLFVIDFFTKDFSCSSDEIMGHGKQVTDVIKLILGSLNLEKVYDSIHLIPVNFFDHLDSSAKLVKIVAGPEFKTADKKQYDDRMDMRTMNLATLEKVRKMKGKSIMIPNIYFSSIFKFIEMKQPDVVSVSVYSDQFDNAFPQFTGQLYNIVVSGWDKPIDISAGLTASYSKASKFQQKTRQPHQSVYMSLEKTGNVFVSGLDNTGSPFGSFSRQNMTIAGHAAGWEGPATCIKSNHLGLSFATPEIATYLFIAKAYWRKQFQKEVDAVQARSRLILSAEIDTLFSNTCAAMGPASLKNLLRSGTSYAEYKDGNMVPVTLSFDAHSIRGEEAVYRLAASGVESNNDPRPTASAIQLVNDRFFICRNQNNTNYMWMPFDIKSMRIKMDTGSGNGFHTYDLEEFKSLFKRIILINNQ